jgi:hypothetical protein
MCIYVRKHVIYLTGSSIEKPLIDEETNATTFRQKKMRICVPNTRKVSGFHVQLTSVVWTLFV